MFQEITILLELMSKKNSNETMPFHPYMVMKDFTALLVFIIIFLWFVFFAPNVLGHPDNYIEANPLVTPSNTNHKKIIIKTSRAVKSFITMYG
jgi:quinol-cytochrome oxidoreductase complex cytochrome b subunit